MSKGVERDTLLRMSEVTLDVLPDHREDRVAVLTGPNLAREVAEGQPAASVIACRDADTTAQLQQLFMTRSFRVYTNPDIVGCEIAGALKNVIAIAVGTAAGLGYGDNAQAALVTRGLAELTRLGVALGGEPLTFAGLAGLGDLVATCTSAEEPEPHRGVRAGAGPWPRRDRRRDEHGGRGSAEHRGGARARGSSRSGDADRRGRRRGALRRPSAGRPRLELMLREAKPELHGLR